MIALLRTSHRQWLPALLLWAVLVMPLLSGFVHGNLAHHGVLADTLGTSLSHDAGHHAHSHEDEGTAGQAGFEHGADHSHDPSKLLPSTVQLGSNPVTCWHGAYCVHWSPAPIAPFERPPKSLTV
ncbi:MAG: hypothetical protein JNM11_07035, partial [Chitinimonas sp.]|nr:hypothetical protein [Chitinimonas sp.]